MLFGAPRRTADPLQRGDGVPPHLYCHLSPYWTRRCCGLPTLSPTRECGPRSAMQETCITCRHRCHSNRGPASQSRRAARLVSGRAERLRSQGRGGPLSTQTHRVRCGMVSCSYAGLRPCGRPVPSPGVLAPTQRLSLRVWPTPGVKRLLRPDTPGLCGTAAPSRSPSCLVLPTLLCYAKYSVSESTSVCSPR